jgi:hypothetical protein
LDIIKAEEMMGGAVGEFNHGVLIEARLKINLSSEIELLGGRL